jgi:hypothetical protein
MTSTHSEPIKQVQTGQAVRSMLPCEWFLVRTELLVILKNLVAILHVQVTNQGQFVDKLAKESRHFNCDFVVLYLFKQF